MTIVEHQAGDHQTHHSRGVMLRNLLPLPPQSRRAQHRAETAHQFAPSTARFADAKHARGCAVSSRISMAPRASEKAARAQTWLAVMASSPCHCEPVGLAANR